MSRRFRRSRKELRDVQALGVQIAIMVGGGNIFRGSRQKGFEIERATGDYMGMLATAINALALQAALEREGVHTRVQSAIAMNEVAEPFIRRRALRHLEKGRIVIFAAGTGNPYFSTDTAAALRAMEIKADVILKATRVDGIYDADPERVSNAKFFSQISYRDVLHQDPEGYGLDGDLVVHGQRHAHRGVQHESTGQHQTSGAGRTRRLDSNAGVSEQQQNFLVAPHHFQFPSTIAKRKAMRTRWIDERSVSRRQDAHGESSR